jgi:hypothetical protein
MKTTRATIVLALAFAAFTALACCARHGATQSEKNASESVLTGTCVDAATGERLSGVKVEAPGGKSAVSGRDGRFEIRGLPAGQGGSVTASTSDGRQASVPLRPMIAGTLEVVLRLAEPR